MTRCAQRTRLSSRPSAKREPGSMYPCPASFSHAGVLGSRVSPLTRLARDDSRDSCKAASSPLTPIKSRERHHAAAAGAVVLDHQQGAEALHAHLAVALLRAVERRGAVLGEGQNVAVKAGLGADDAGVRPAGGRRGVLALDLQPALALADGDLATGVRPGAGPVGEPA